METGELLMLTIFSTMHKGEKTSQNVAIIYISFHKEEGRNSIII